MPIEITLTLPDTTAADQLVGYGAGAVIKLQRDTTSAFPAPTTVTSVALVSGTESYLYWDASGTVTSWYRTRYESATGTNPDPSDWSAGFQPGVTGLCSLQAVKDRLGISDTISDELLAGFIDEATTVIQNEVDRRFVPDSDGTLLLDGAGASDARTLPVPLGISTLTKLETASQTGGTFVEVPITEVFLRPPAAQRQNGAPATTLVISEWSAGRFYYGIENVRLTGTFGYGAVPADVAGVCMRAVIKLFQAKGSGVATASGGEGFGTLLLQNISPEDHKILAYYRTPVIG